jgi:hypothetical protein
VCCSVGVVGAGWTGRVFAKGARESNQPPPPPLSHSESYSEIIRSVTEVVAVGCSLIPQPADTDVLWQFRHVL